MSNQSKVVKNQRWLRFRLKSLLLLILFVAVVFAVFELGRNLGFDEGESAGYAAGVSAATYPRVYRVADFLVSIENSALPDYQSLIDEIQKEVQPTTWESAGGPATLSEYPANKSLVVSQTSRGHDELSAFFKAKHKRSK